MEVRDIISIIAIIISPIIAVVIGQYLQNREKMRNDKMLIFRTLMSDRGMPWSQESVKALNILEIVFSDDKDVLNQWKDYFDKLLIENPTDTDLTKIKVASDKLLDVMAKSLGYKDKVTWETIQKPYIPKSVTDNISQQQQYQNMILAVMSMMMNNMGNQAPPVNGDDIYGAKAKKPSKLL